MTNQQNQHSRNHLSLVHLSGKRLSRHLAAVSALVLSGSMYSATALAASDQFIDTEFTLGLDDNVTRAANNVDIEHDGFMTLAGTGGMHLLESQTGQLTAGIHLAANNFFRFSGLSNLVAAGRLSYSYAFGTSFRSPWIKLEGEYGVAEFDSLYRDSNIGRATMTLGMNIDDATTIRLGANYTDRDAESTVFDTRTTAAFASLDWRVLEKHIIYLTYKYQTGDTFSSVSPDQVDAAKASAVIDSVDIVVDDVFTDKVTYKIDADIQFITLGYNWIQDLHSSFDLSARYLESKANDVDIDYQDLVVRLSYFRRFDL